MESADPCYRWYSKGIMNNVNDIVNQRLKTTTLNNDIGVLFKKSVDPEVRSDAQNEALAARLCEKLGGGSNLLPYLAVAYSGIPEATLDRLAGLAKEGGSSPPKLFMWFVKREPLWSAYKKRRDDRKGEGQDAS